MKICRVLRIEIIRSEYENNLFVFILFLNSVDLSTIRSGIANIVNDFVLYKL